MSQSKNAVVVGKVNLQPRKEVVVKPKPIKQERREEKPRRQERPVDPRTQNTVMLQELQFVKKQLAQAKFDLQNYSNLRYASVELLKLLKKTAETSDTAALHELETQTTTAVEMVESVLATK